MASGAILHSVYRGRGGGVVARGAEVALAGDQRVPQRPVLHQADEGVVDRRVAVRVVLAHDVADDAASTWRTGGPGGSRRRTSRTARGGAPA